MPGYRHTGKIGREGRAGPDYGGCYERRTARRGPCRSRPYGAPGLYRTDGSSTKMERSAGGDADEEGEGEVAQGGLTSEEGEPGSG